MSNARAFQILLTVFGFLVLAVCATDAALDSDWARASTCLLAFIALELLDVWGKAK